MPLISDDGGMGGRTRSLDSIGDDIEEEREIPAKKKKHRPEESVSTGKKAQRRHQEEKESTEGTSLYASTVVESLFLINVVCHK